MQDFSILSFGKKFDIKYGGLQINNLTVRRNYVLQLKIKDICFNIDFAEAFKIKAKNNHENIFDTISCVVSLWFKK